jgi:hypothetical protein
MGGYLPPGFNRWDLADKKGWTVAHEDAKNVLLPEGFDLWDFVDEDGKTVLHAAAMGGYLPPGFNRWDLADKKRLDGRARGCETYAPSG